MTDPFTTLGLEPSMDLERKVLETRYLALSREAHPDHNSGNAEALDEAVRRSAAINDAYRAVRNLWRRAEVLIERIEPGCMERTKTLPPAFLMEAMELAEDVAAITSATESGSESAVSAGAETAETAKKATMRQGLEAKTATYLQQIHDHLNHEDAESAARCLHEARYYRKALEDLNAA